MATPHNPEDRRVLLLYELFAAAGGSKCPPVSPELAELVATHVSAEELAVIERVYRAVEHAVATGAPDDALEDVFARVMTILSQPH